MTEHREGGWAKSLTEVERAVDACLAALERYETMFAALLTEVGTAAPAPERVHLPNSVEWERRLAAAQTHVDGIEQLLQEQETIWTGWQQSYRQWRDTLEKVPVTRG